ncbi:PAS domain-containing protein [Variovorax sp. J2P1-59]|uniref:PAS domain-containing protein n=1 Tax=Variovorax flavidus TaxID=3053501 RepID=UPI0025761980|nr:PAS domain-containing protein [Variovorax sp. J2P1-59]MDM0078482.1 PAS domain-containing protein [Variovorax sp. J2P1-59]
MHSPIPIVLLWGPDGIMVYNDAYARFAGRRHPQILGAKVLEAWPEVAEFNANIMKVVMAGGTLTYHDRELVLDRRGVMEKGWMDLGYSPVIAENGRPGGVIAIVVETTERVLAQMRAASERDRLAQLFAQAPTFMALLEGPEHCYRLSNPGYDRLVGGRTLLGRTVAEALPEVVGQGFTRILDRVYETGEPYSAVNSKVLLQDEQTKGRREYYLDFVYQPVNDDEGHTTGIFVQGVDVTERVRAEHRREVLIGLTDALASLEEPEEIVQRASEALGRALSADRVGYATIDASAETVHVKDGWNAPAIASLSGSFSFGDYGTFVDNLKDGRTVVVADVSTDERTCSHAAAFAGLRVASFINVPIIERQRLVALMFVHYEQAHDPPEQDIALAREVAARTRSAVERVRGARDLRLSEGRFRFLDELNRGVGTAQDADQVLSLTTRMAGESMKVSICAYADMDEDEDSFTIRGDWVAPGMTTIVGRYRLTDFGSLAVDRLRAGLPLVINDNMREIAPHEAATFQAIGISATICMPLVKLGRLKALMAVHDRQPRIWTDSEIALIREVTERSWAHVERVAAEAGVRASEENFRTLARALPNQVWTASAEGKLDWVNDTVYGYTGTPPGELEEQGMTAIVHPEDLATARDLWVKAVASGQTYQTEFRLRRHDGTYRWHIGRAVPSVTGGRVVRWIGSNTDIQDQKETQTALADLNAVLEQRVRERTGQLVEAEEALRQAQKMEAVGQLTGGLAHDFNNLLAAIGGSLALIKRQLPADSARLERYMETAEGAVRRAASLTHRLLAFSRRQALDPKPTDVNRLIASMEDLIRRSVGPDVSVGFVGGDQLWVTKIDPSQLENALLNLCINARDAMAPRGGRLTIETANKSMDDRAARRQDLKPGQYISLRVSDTGAGMKPEIIQRAFDPFFTTKPIGQGTGLGLSMVYGFVRQSGGQVRIDSEVGQGTSVCLYLPRFADSVEAPMLAPSAPVCEGGTGETVVLIDDEPAVRMLISDVLREAGYEVVEAGTGADGLRLMDPGRRVDLLITDVGLPGGMNGRQVADAIRTSRPNLKVLFITGYAENAVIGNGQLAPGMDLLTKPFDITELAAKVRAILDRA